MIIHSTSYPAVSNISQRYLRPVVYMEIEHELLLISIFRQKKPSTPHSPVQGSYSHLMLTESWLVRRKASSFVTASQDTGGEQCSD